MKKIFLDTNFVIDYLLREEWKPICQELLARGIRSKKKFYISYLTVANFAYIARKLPKDILYYKLDLLLSLFIVEDNTNRQIKRAIGLKAKDFEDALQYQTAIDADCDCIITRNEQDFGFSTIPVMSASKRLFNNHC